MPDKEVRNPPQHELDASPVLQHMKDNGIPMTRENFIQTNWGDQVPDDWGAEHEDEIPDCLKGYATTDMEDDANGDD